MRNNEKKTEKDFGALSRFVQESFASSEPTPMLYQYSDIGALCGLVKNRELWATHFRYLNDRKEFDLGLKYAIDFAKSQYERQNSFFVKKFLKTFCDIEEVCEEKHVLPFHRLGIFARSFSSKCDLLSQWRGYGRGYKSVCMGFSKDELEKSLFVGNQTCLLRKVIYDLEKQETLVYEFMKRCCQIFANNPQDFIDDERYFESIRRVLVTGLVQLILGFKEKCWEEEAEWRVIAIQDNSVLDYKQNAFGLVPFIKLPIALNVLKTVMLPKSENYILSRKSLKMFLSRYNGVANVEVEESDISIVY